MVLVDFVGDVGDFFGLEEAFDSDAVGAPGGGEHGQLAGFEEFHWVYRLGMDGWRFGLSLG